MRSAPVPRYWVLMVLAAAGAVSATAAFGQATPPPGVEAARPPTERTLQPVDKTQTRERVRTTTDCRKVEEDMRAEYRIQADAVRSQYSARIDKATDGARESLVKERDAKIEALNQEGLKVAKTFRAKCREDNRSLLHSPVSPAEAR